MVNPNESRLAVEALLLRDVVEYELMSAGNISNEKSTIELVLMERFRLSTKMGLADESPGISSAVLPAVAF
jgi:hypothetical protein